jgi:hypothetical protein
MALDKILKTTEWRHVLEATSARPIPPLMSARADEAAHLTARPAAAFVAGIMANGRRLGFSIAVLGVLALCGLLSVTLNGRAETGALCGGTRFERRSVPPSALPFISLAADGVEGLFLLDYGSTRSSLSAQVFGKPVGTVKAATLSLPSFQKGEFDLKEYPPAQGPDRQIGVIGADFLSHLSVQMTDNFVFLGAEPCHAEALSAQNLVPVGQRGFFSSNLSDLGRGLPNVPVVFLRVGKVAAWAQIDTGYDDRVYSHSVDINQALYDRLIQSGVELDPLKDLTVWTCEGPERRRVFSVKGLPLVVENEQAQPIVEIGTFHLIVKNPNRCGGIGAMSTPAAQLGASFLALFGTVIFDPKSQTVWLGRGADGNQ